MHDYETYSYMDGWSERDKADFRRELNQSYTKADLIEQYMGSGEEHTRSRRNPHGEEQLPEHDAAEKNGSQGVSKASPNECCGVAQLQVCFGEGGRGPGTQPAIQ